MATFGLVRGVCAGAWCWHLLAPYLGDAGHDVVVVDLPCEDPEEIVLVGHPTGGFTITLVAARRPVRELVYLWDDPGARRA